MTACIWCAAAAGLCMHTPLTEEEEAARFRDWLIRSGQKLERTPDDDPFYTEAS